MNSETVFQRFEATVNRVSANAPFLHVLEETSNIYGIEAGDITYAAMLAQVLERARLFAEKGYRAGHRVGLLLENRPVYLEIWLALNSLGVSVVPINPDLRVAELEYLIDHSEMVLAIVLPGRLDEVRQAIVNAGLSIPVISPIDDLPESTVSTDRATGERVRATELGSHVGGESTSNTLAPTRVEHAERETALPLNSMSECALLYTSGTTGKPKGCILSNEYFLHCGDWYAQAGGHISLRHDSERMITPLPLFHMNAMAVSVTAMITVGGCLILPDRFHPRSWWESVQKSMATVVHYLGVMPSMLMGAEPSDADTRHSVRFGFGAGVDKKLHAAFESRFGFPLIEAWACTETGSGAVISAHEEPRHVGTSCFGRACENVDVRVIDDTGVDVAIGTPGELLVRRAGDNPRYGFFSGYLKNSQATDELWNGGWLNTGDVVVQHDDGSLHFIDRKKNVIRRSGENIAAVEVESILNRHPAIAMCAAGAAPDELRGDEVAVFIVLHSKSEHEPRVKTNSDTDNRNQAFEIVQWAMQQMAYYKAPGWIAFIDELPVTATQKLLRGELKTLLNQTLDANGFIDTRHLKKRTV